MQIELIDTFIDLLETRSFNRTAERLGVTQSTVSARVAALEKLVGRKLFTRSRAGAELTTVGLKFEPHARGLRRGWSEALRAARSAGNAALSMRVGLQTDLAAANVGDWVAEFREVLPETAFYLELDYSTQMCADLVAGNLDFAVMYSPRPDPDLHFESVGEVRYRFVSTDGRRRCDLDPARYIRANYARAFDQQHQQLLPEFEEAPVSSGQNTAVTGLLTTLGGSAFVLDKTAQALVASGTCQHVEDVPDIMQSVYAAIHVRHRRSHVYRRLLAIVRRHFGGRPPALSQPG